MRYRDAAICIRAYDYSETSQVLGFLTRENGVLRVMAKGTKRPKGKSGGAVDLMAQGDLSYTQKNLDALAILVEFSESVSRRAIRRNARRLNAGLFCVELTGLLLAEGDPHPEVYDLLNKTLDRLAHDDAPIPAVLAWFQWRLLRFVGLLGGMDHCVSCGLEVAEFAARKDAGFSSQLGGLLCDGCSAQAKDLTHLSPAALAGFGALAAAEA